MPKALNICTMISDSLLETNLTFWSSCSNSYDTTGEGKKPISHSNKLWEIYVLFTKRKILFLYIQNIIWEALRIKPIMYSQKIRLANKKKDNDK